MAMSSKVESQHSREDSALHGEWRARDSADIGGSIYKAVVAAKTCERSGGPFASEQGLQGWSENVASRLSKIFLDFYII